MDDDQQFCLRWNNHQSTLISVFDTLLENGTLVDCTLAAEGKFLKAHKVVLSACSPYFATLLSQQYDKHPIFILKDVKFQELRAMMDYMYRGEVNISQDQLAALLKAAESLQIKGLSDSRSGGNSIGGGGSGVGPKSAAEHKPLSVPVASAAMKGASPSGFTIEQKRPRHTIGGPSSIESQSGSREGSSSPTSRKRKKMRRRSIDNINADNHEHSNSSSQSMKINSSVPQSNTSATAITSVQSAVVSATQQQQQQAAIGGSGGGAAAAAGSGLNVTKKTDSISSNTKLETTGTEHDLDTENGNEHDDNIGKSINARKEQNHKRKQHAADVDDGKDGGEILIEPKSEYEEGNDETVEDLTLDDEELLEDLDQAGPSHGGGEGSSQGYAQWQVDRSQDDVFMATQEAAGQQRDPQGAYWTILETVPISTTGANQHGTTTTVHSDCSNLITQATVVVQIPSNAHHIQYDGKVAKVEEVVFEEHETTAVGSVQAIEDITVTEATEEEEEEEHLTMKAEEYKLMVEKTDTTLQPLQYVCNKCGKGYKIKGSLKRHVSYECGISPTLACKFCKHKSKYKSDLRKHMIQRHSEQNIEGF